MCLNFSSTSLLIIGKRVYPLILPYRYTFITDLKQGNFIGNSDEKELYVVEKWTRKLKVSITTFAFSVKYLGEQ